eukprot:TRINITY_DN18361_c0_g1_i1.p1 TRINITY_DN18361_c0_g1~~TRINITY_DN18361_c0_g1_i1.p1  ORF type:complete len:184 (-),score=34.17 TRINITY_DN18361_c0_g1_i1:24-575(-)
MSFHGTSGSGKLFSYPKEVFDGKKPSNETMSFSPAKTKVTVPAVVDSQTGSAVPLPEYCRTLFTKQGLDIVKQYIASSPEHYQKRDLFDVIAKLNDHVKKTKAGQTTEVRATRRDADDVSSHSVHFLADDVALACPEWLAAAEPNDKNKFRNSFRRLFVFAHPEIPADQRPTTPENQKPRFLQ